MASGRNVYLDHNATTPLHPEVREAITQAMPHFGNPSSLHSRGRHAREMVEEARATVAGFIGAAPSEVMFIGSGSEGNNTVLSAVTCKGPECGVGSLSGAGIVTSSIEHPCILETSHCLVRRGVKVDIAGVGSDGRVDLDHLESLIGPGTVLVSVMLANNETGTIQDIAAISGMAHGAGALMHTDAVQGVGKVPVDVHDLDVDFLTMSAHKIYGPKGVGALYVKSGVPFCPLIHGGHQECGRRAGTENTLGIVGLGKAIEMRAREMEEEHWRLSGLRGILKEGIESSIPDVMFSSDQTSTLPTTLNVSFMGAEGESILLYLDMMGIEVSTGSACASGSAAPSHVLVAMGTPAEYVHGSIRMSMGRETSREDIEYVLEVLPGVIGKLRGMSTTYGRV
jgi:cysteine desulfurase